MEGEKIGVLTTVFGDFDTTLSTMGRTARLKLNKEYKI